MPVGIRSSAVGFGLVPVPINAGMSAQWTDRNEGIESTINQTRAEFDNHRDAVGIKAPGNHQVPQIG